MKKKILLITEYLNPPYDEGIKKTVFNLFKELDKKYDLCVICRYGFKKVNIHIVNTNPLFFDSAIKKIIRDFEPEILLYLPFASMTFASYLRLFVLKKYTSKIKSIIFALQPKSLSKWQESIIKFIKPTVALTPSLLLKDFWDRLKFNNKLLPLYTELNDFKPIGDNSTKILLRKKYNIPLDKYVISHMGHLNEGRNLESLIPLQKAGYQIVIVGSSSTPKDSLGSDQLKQKLMNTGIIIIDKYLEKISEIYQLSDLYIFPVINNCSSIGLPLSILEARACGIPVLTTKFESTNFFLGNDYGNVFYSKPSDFVLVVKKINKFNSDRLKTSVTDINEKYNQIIFSEIENS
ncbi:MAG: glycosyltransferase [Candidatus Tenebribacter burtonii]|nr:glycosyltransferase [Candidatus Tenebribacter burtonii]